jgi:4-hydroxy-tetrahydrodipicolinate synthase
MKTLEQIFGKVAIPLMTPFNRIYEVDYLRTCQLAERVIDRNYCDSLIIAGTNGEFHALTYAERIHIFKEIKLALGERISLIAGTGAPTTDETIRLTKEAENLGYAAAMVLPPYYGKPTQDELIEHFFVLAESTSLPIVLYNIPIFTSVNIEPDTTVKLAEIENIIGIKEEAALLPLQTSDVLMKLPENSDFSIYCGDDTMVLSVLAQGGSGAVSGGSHITGDLMKAMIEAFQTGQVIEAIELNRKIYRFAQTLSIGKRTNPVTMTKIALALTGFDVGPPRRPFLPPAQKEIDVMKSILREIGKL